MREAASKGDTPNALSGSAKDGLRCQNGTSNSRSFTGSAHYEVPVPATSLRTQIVALTGSGVRFPYGLLEPEAFIGAHPDLLRCQHGTLRSEGGEVRVPSGLRSYPDTSINWRSQIGTSNSTTSPLRSQNASLNRLGAKVQILSGSQTELQEIFSRSQNAALKDCTEPRHISAIIQGILNSPLLVRGAGGEGSYPPRHSSRRCGTGPASSASSADELNFCRQSACRGDIIGPIAPSFLSTRRVDATNATTIPHRHQSN